MSITVVGRVYKTTTVSTTSTAGDVCVAVRRVVGPGRSPPLRRVRCARACEAACDPLAKGAGAGGKTCGGKSAESTRALFLDLDLRRMLSIVSSAIAMAGNIRITRVQADANLLFPTNAKRLTKFMMDETFGTVKPFTGAWAQRSVLDATANSDFFSRLKYYDDERSNGRACGCILVAEREDDGMIAGFADIGASLWLPKDGAFRLPQHADLQRLATTGVGTDGQRKPGVKLRPYVSNLVVDTSMRRSGIGRQLMQACEEECSTWADACSVDDVYSRRQGSRTRKLPLCSPLFLLESTRPMLFCARRACVWCARAGGRVRRDLAGGEHDQCGGDRLL